MKVHQLVNMYILNCKDEIKKQTFFALHLLQIFCKNLYKNIDF